MSSKIRRRLSSLSPSQTVRRFSNLLSSPRNSSRNNEFSQSNAALAVEGAAFVDFVTRELAAQNNPVSLETCTTAEFVFNFVLPFTKDKALFHFVPKKFKYALPFDSKSNEEPYEVYYVSHSWNRPMRELLQYLSDSDELFWLDFVAINQHESFHVMDADVAEGSIASHAFNDLLKESRVKKTVVENSIGQVDASLVHETVKACSDLVLLVDPQGACFTRTWILFELAAARAESSSSETKTHMEFPFFQQGNAFQESLEESMSILKARIKLLRSSSKKVAFSESKTSVIKDRRAINDYVSEIELNVDGECEATINEQADALEQQLEFYREASTAG